jgi:type II secretory pathway pseudopilin PulG
MRIVSLRRQCGVTLLETLLAVSLAALMFVSLSSLLADTQRERRAALEAEQFQSFQRAAAAYFLAKRPEMLLAMATGPDGEQDPDRLCQQRQTVTINDKTRVVCAVSVVQMEQAGFLPTGFQPVNAFGEPLFALFRRVKDAGDELTENVEMLAVAVAVPGQAVDPKRSALSLSAAGVLGAAGGIVPTRSHPGRCGANKPEGFWVCGNGWEVQLEGFGLTLPPA